MSIIKVDQAPEFYRDMARKERVEQADSWERSDTDGFLSQWAAGQMASIYMLAAQVAEKEGTWEFDAVFDIDGNLQLAEEREGEWGSYWLVRKDDGSTVLFSPSKAKKPETRQANDAKKGFQMGTVRMLAGVDTRGYVIPVGFAKEITSIRHYEEW